jgi:hypothetical protein
MDKTGILHVPLSLYRKVCEEEEEKKEEECTSRTRTPERYPRNIWEEPCALEAVIQEGGKCRGLELSVVAD